MSVQAVRKDECLAEVTIAHGFMLIGNGAMCITSCSIDGDIKLIALPSVQKVRNGSSARGTCVLRMQRNWRLWSAH